MGFKTSWETDEPSCKEQYLPHDRREGLDQSIATSEDSLGLKGLRVGNLEMA